ncbi:MAG: hypothetical protein IJ242_09050 [Clostridia bacterium]|nr:hypothetical protein [Clostridia bacterium]
MSYIAQLNEKELTFFAKALSPKLLRRMLKANKKKIEPVKPGFKPDQLSDASLVSFVVNYQKNVEVIRDFLELWIVYNIQMTGETRNYMIKNGKNADEAMTFALLKYVFRDHVDLYFRLADQKMPDGYIQLMAYTVKLAGSSETVEPSDIPKEWLLENQKAFEKWMDELSSEYEARVADTEKENREVKQSLEENRRELSKIKSQLLQTENSKSSLQQSLNETKQQLNEVKAQLSEKEEALQQKEEALRQKEEELEKSAAHPEQIVSPDTQEPNEPKTYSPAQGLSFMSICRPYIDDRGMDRLLRLADVNEKGEILDEYHPDAPQLFRLFRKDGPSDPGYLGVWDWKNIPNLNNPIKQYFLCSFHEWMEPVEIIVQNGVKSILDLTESLRDGIEQQYAPDRLLYAFYNGSEYEGVYLTFSQLTERDGKLFLNQNIQSLPVYRILASDIITLEGISYYRYIDLPASVGTASTRENMDIVKSIMLANVLWPSLKEHGFQRSDLKMVRDFIESIPTPDVIDRIAKVCECSREEAQQLADRFVSNGAKYINDITLGSDEVAQLIRSTPALRESYEAAITEKWTSDNQEKVNTAEAHLNELNAQRAECQQVIDTQQAELSHLQEETASCKEKLKDLEGQILEAETRQPLEMMPMGTQLLSPIMEPGFFEEMPWQNGELMENHSWSDVLVSIEIALLEAGVAQYALDGLAACLYGAFLNHIPLIITGPNSCDIVRAFSIALKGREPGVMRCGFEPAAAVVRRCREASAEVVMIEQPFSAAWGSELYELVAQRQKFFVAVHPFAEDLTTAPRGLLNYFLPVMSELFIEKSPGDQYRGARIMEDFSPLPSRQTTYYHDNFLRLLRINTLTKNTLDRLLTDMHALLETVQADSDYMFLLYPLSYMTGNLTTLKENLGKTQTDSPVSMGIRNFLSPYLRDC